MATKHPDRKIPRPATRPLETLTKIAAQNPDGYFFKLYLLSRTVVQTFIEQSSIADEEVSVESAESISLINTVYEQFVFAIDSQSDENPEKYFSDNALKKLQKDYEFDCDEGSCYAFYALRTEMQDSNPDTDGASKICDIELDRDGWYIVSYSDMGWTGKTRIKIIDGKVDDYQRIEP